MYRVYNLDWYNANCANDSLFCYSGYIGYKRNSSRYKVYNVYNVLSIIKLTPVVLFIKFIAVSGPRVPPARSVQSLGIVYVSSLHNTAAQYSGSAIVPG